MHIVLSVGVLGAQECLGPGGTSCIAQRGEGLLQVTWVAPGGLPAQFLISNLVVVGSVFSASSAASGTLLFHQSPLPRWLGLGEEAYFCRYRWHCWPRFSNQSWYRVLIFDGAAHERLPYGGMQTLRRR